MNQIHFATTKNHGLQMVYRIKITVLQQFTLVILTLTLEVCLFKQL